VTATPATAETPPAAPVDAALRAFADAVGAGHVSADEAEVRLAGTATFATARRPVAIVRPGSRAEVQACVRAAAAHGVSVYPVSRGCNWGYGSRVPARDGAVLLSLERLTDIVDFDERLGWAAVEPGVTFRQLDAFLRGRGSRLHLNGPGSTPDASIVGNTLERGVTQGVMPDAAARVGALEVVLADGSVVRTGSSALPGSRAARVHRHGVGPALDGLFLQSSLGIVTEMTVWLSPVPAFHRHFHFVVDEDDGLPAVVDALRSLCMEGTLTTSVALHNDWKVMALTGRYPWAHAAGRTPLPDDLRAGRMAELGGGRWFGEAAVHGPTTAVMEALRSRVSEVLAPLVREVDWSEPNAPGPFFGGDVGHALEQAYWRRPGPLPPDPHPDRDGCGVIWHSPALPFDGDAVLRCVDAAEAVLAAHGFEPTISLQAVSPRCVYAVISILFDRAAPGEDERAVRCHTVLAERLAADGFHPYRLGLLDAGGPSAPDEATRALLHTLRQALDPAGVLAPGRYDFGL
jgi:4-cresol dehydrogenase (hydroxylating)